MVICHCRRVNDRTIADLAARYRADFDEICGRSGAGTECGGCRDSIRTLLDTGTASTGPDRS